MELKDLTAEDLLGDTDIEIVAVPLPKRGVAYVRGMSGGERDEWETEQVTLLEQGKAAGKDNADMVNFRARFLVRVICDAKGNLLFKPSQVAEISRLSARLLDRLYAAAKKLSAVTKEDEKELLGN